MNLEFFIDTIESALGKKAIKNYMPMQKGDVVKTYADVSALEALINYTPKTELHTGIQAFVEWYQQYYQS